MMSRSGPESTRIAVIRQFYFPLDTRVRREVDALLEAGHDVEVICLRASRERRRERRGRLTIWRLPLRHRRAGGLLYIAEHVAFLSMAAAFVAARHARRRFDLVQVNSIPDSLVFAALVPKLLGARVLLDLHECMPEFFATRFGTALSHPGVRLVALVEQASIRFADGAITCTEPMRQAFAGRGADSARVGVVLNAADEKVFRPRYGDGRLSEPYGFTLLCHGTIEERYGLDTVIRAIALLKEELPGLRFEVYGEGSFKPELERLCRQLAVEDRVSFSEGFVPLDELVAAIAAADAGVVAMKRDAFRDLTHCNKMFDFLAMRRPVIVSWTRSVAEYFDDSALAFFRSDDPVDLAGVIRRLAQQPGERAALVENATRQNEPYRWPHQKSNYLSVVDRLAHPVAE